MSARYDTTERFFRPNDVAALRRNQRRIQIQRIILVGSRVLVVAAVVVAAGWTWRHTQSDARFALKTIEVTGAVHTPRASVDSITRAYVGGNLFKLDIANVQNDLGKLGWISRIEAEKKLPDTLRVRIVERTPVALLQSGDRLRYVDESGVAFAELSPSVGDSDLPLISGLAGAPSGAPGNAGGAELARCVALLRALRARDAEVYARISEVRPVAPDAFALFDRQLGTVVYASASDLTSKWRELHAIAQSENLDRGAIEYADLRFANRIVIKSSKAAAPPPHSEMQGAIHAED
jgi:cell division protein FtsQ